MSDIKPNVIEAYDSPEEQAEDARTNKLESKGLNGSNKVTTTKSGGPFPAEAFGKSVVDYATGYKQTTIDPATPHMVDPNNC